MNRQMRIEATELIAFLKRIHFVKRVTEGREESFLLDESDGGSGSAEQSDSELLTASSSNLLQRDGESHGDAATPE